MWQPLHDFSAKSLVHAIEANTIEFLLALGRAAGAEERNEPQIQWVIGGSPIDYHNCVVRADLSPAGLTTRFAYRWSGSKHTARPDRGMLVHRCAQQTSAHDW
jgi:hypothetical protein